MEEAGHQECSPGQQASPSALSLKLSRPLRWEEPGLHGLSPQHIMLERTQGVEQVTPDHNDVPFSIHIQGNLVVAS